MLNQTLKVFLKSNQILKFSLILEERKKETKNFYKLKNYIY